MTASMIAAARRTIVLADSAKFNHQLLGHIAALQHIDILVTDAAPPGELFRALEELEVQVLIAPTLNSRQRDKAMRQYI
jgi:DeoR family transcriptional regulator, fructose operon transcriptional repressor